MHQKTKKVLEKSKQLKRTMTGKPIEPVEVSDSGKNVPTNSNQNASHVQQFDSSQLKM